VFGVRVCSSSTDGKAGPESPDKPKTSVYGSLKNFFTGVGAGDDKTTAKPQTKPKKKRKSGGKKARRPPKAELPKETRMEISKDDEDWFNDMDADGFGGNAAAGGSESVRNSDAGGVGGPPVSRTNISSGKTGSAGNHGAKKSVSDDGANDFAP